MILDLNDPKLIEMVSQEQIPSLLCQLAAVQSALSARLLMNGYGERKEGDKLLDVEQAAQKLKVSKDWLYRRSKKLPFVVRMGKNLRFSEQGIDGYIKRRKGR